MTGKTNQRELFVSLTQDFLTGLPKVLGEIETGWAQVWREGPHAAALDNVLQRVHSLSGSAATLGFDMIARSANNLQAVLQSLDRSERPPDSDALSEAESAMQMLRRAIYTDQQIDLNKLSQRIGIAEADSASLHEKRASRHIYLVEDDPIQAADLADQVGYFGYSMQVFHSPAELEDALEKFLPTAILMDVSFPDGAMAGYETISKLKEKHPQLPPIIYITIHDRLPFRLQAVRVGGIAYFTKPVDVSALIDVLDRLTLEEHIPTSRVLIVDDSSFQAKYIATQLDNAGITTEIVSDPLQVLNHMISFNPDLILLDMYMPDCTGMELAMVIRQMEQFVSVPIVFMSAESDKEIQLAAIGIGGDDFLTKPIEPQHLISSVTTRVERYRKLRSLMIQDGLTGLLNHRTIKERLAQEVERSKRYKGKLSLAMIDLDHFKVVNDTYGHATGDRVLKSVAHMLKQRLRSTDTIGRYGGEEFAVILPDTDEKDAVRIMTEMCESYAKIHHYSGDQEFTVTFSCGVASFSDSETASELSVAADTALYEAKAAGRNRVYLASHIDGHIQNKAPSRSARRVPTNGRARSLNDPDGLKPVEADLNQTVTYLSSLNRILHAVTGTNEYAVVIREISREVARLFNAQHVGVSLLSEDRNTLEFIGDSQEGWNENPGAANQIYLPDDPASQQVVQNGEAIFVGDAMRNPLTRGSHILLRAHGIHNRMIAPLIARGEVIGTLNIDFTSAERQVTKIDLDLAESIAVTIASVIENRRLFNAEQRQREYFEALVNNIPVAVVTIDSKAKIRSWNPAAHKLFGYTESEVIDQNVDELLSSEDYTQEANSYTLDILQDSKLIHAITRRKRKDGSLADVELFAVPVFVDQVHSGSMAIYHDISDLQQARRDSEAANQAKSAFLATMSHEIRTPLNAIVGMTTLLLDTPLNREQLEFSEMIRSSSDALLTIINDILDFSKIEAGRMELEEQAFDLRECVETALDLVAAKATEKSIDLAYLFDPDVPSVIISDSTRLRQILLNLLSNALKFTEEGEVVLSISAQPLEDEDRKRYRLHFSVRDTGIGIPPDRKSLLFQSFSQLDASTTRKYGGTGLGLAISKRLAELLGGEMWVESTGVPGEGATFNFTIETQKSTSPIPVFLHLKQPELKGKRVLIVDDNATNRYILMRQVRSWEMEPKETADPQQALEWIRAGQEFDLALLDMQMPEMDGATLAEEIVKHFSGQPAFPLMMLTSLGLKDTNTEKQKFSAYLTKPIKPAVLYSKLLEVFNERSPSRKPRQDKARITEIDKTGQESLRILLAEDTVVNQKVAILLLQKIGYRADIAGNGLEVLEALRRQPYDVILMDVQMPELDGLEAARQVRSGAWQNGNHAGSLALQPYIIAMTANAMQGDREKCLAAGMDDYVSKPIQIEELNRALQEATVSIQKAKQSSAGNDEKREDEGELPALDEQVFQKFHRSMGRENPDSVIAMLIKDFLEEAPQLINELNQAQKEGDLERIRRSSHSLKSSSMLFGAVRLANICKSMEIAAKDHDTEPLGNLLDQVDLEYQRVENALQSRLEANEAHSLPAF